MRTRLIVTTEDEKGREHRYPVTNHPNDLFEMNKILHDGPETIIETREGSLSTQLRDIVQPGHAEKLTRLRNNLRRRKANQS